MPTIALPLPRYTVADLDRFPDDGNRYELLEGWLIVTPAPGSRHQGLVVELTTALHAYLGRGVTGYVYVDGTVPHATDTRLIPDILVTSRQGRPGMEWSAMTER
ncbi:MAG: Uma2 family endonuclease, partial [Gemmatirosa sp.]